MRQLDYNNAIAVARDIYWVGFYDKEANLHCNPYLLVDDEEVVFFDPGSIPHFPIVMRKVIDMVNPKDISVIVASHQDPDVCGNLAVVEDVIERTDLKVAAHINAIRLIRHYGIHSEFYPVDENEFRLTLKSGRVLEFIFAPFLHAPGAVMTYDPQSKSLFSGDIFGAISVDWSLFAKKDFTEPMAAFHRLYMPDNKNLRHCMEGLKKYDILRILPQHGSVLEGDHVQAAIQHLKTLACGVDLVSQ